MGKGSQYRHTRNWGISLSSFWFMVSFKFACEKNKVCILLQHRELIMPSSSCQLFVTKPLQKHLLQFFPFTFSAYFQLLSITQCDCKLFNKNVWICTMIVREVFSSAPAMQIDLSILLWHILNISHDRRPPSEQAFVSIGWNYRLSKYRDMDRWVHKHHGWFLTCYPDMH